MPTRGSRRQRRNETSRPEAACLIPSRQRNTGPCQAHLSARTSPAHLRFPAARYIRSPRRLRRTVRAFRRIRSPQIRLSVSSRSPCDCCSILRTQTAAPLLRYSSASAGVSASENRTLTDRSAGLRGWPAPGRAPPRFVVVIRRIVPSGRGADSAGRMLREGRRRGSPMLRSADQTGR